MRNILKSLIICVGMAIALPATAVVLSDITLCRVQVNSGTKYTILSLPLTELGVEGDYVSLDKVVLTENLEQGSKIVAKDGNSVFMWELVNGVWEPLTTVSSGSMTEDSSCIVGMERGSAFWVIRAGDEEALAKPFYIYGLVGEDLSGEQVIAAGSEEVPAYTRIGNPNPEDVMLNDLIWSGCTDGDIVAIGDKNTLGFREYIWNSAKAQWGNYESQSVVAANGRTRVKSVWVSDIMIPAGQAFWYIRKSPSTATVRFK